MRNWKEGGRELGEKAVGSRRVEDGNHKRKGGNQERWGWEPRGNSSPLVPRS